MSHLEQREKFEHEAVGIISTALAASLSEEDLQRHVVNYAKMHGWMVYHTYDSRRSQAGFPDLLCVKDGKIVVIELKSQKGKVSQTQWDWLAALDGSRVVTAEIYRPSDWYSGEIDRILA